ncbi:membrane-bound acylglycerophosphatidylinositol O-acyltransferase MBOAT7 isoform X2 [Microcaecilia unicolor]|nr:lysophospholipid acyltransferase 7 isoform X2 [Microcaecilia unicolor]XP_030053755.1 lysophospholipid acyltransferase 7 isoform X2 [Microcaecilia unicolor]XP_030053756.1 lysophospholipid acyltransferase 7 isoform X2 [Microcaecilia unicolor]
MTPDELTYLAILTFSVPIGFIFKRKGPGVKQLGGAGLGVLLILLTCQIHSLHSLITILVTWLILKVTPRSCHFLVLSWTFIYLLFFRTITYFRLPPPTPFTNAVQLLLTLKMVSLANEVQEYCKAKREDISSFRKPVASVIPRIPSLVEMLCYSYCYVGLMTGPFYRYKTYHDWLQQLDSAYIPSWRPLLLRLRPAPIFGLLFLLVSHLFPLAYVQTDDFYERPFLYRLFYMVPTFFVFRMRFYVAWIFAECGCISAAFGAYPAAAKSRPGGGPTVDYTSAGRSPEGERLAIEYDYETIKNIDCYGTDFSVKVKDGMRYWNMTVQWWLARYIYKNSPVRYFILRSTWTMLISAYWHGIHPGYYLSFLTIPLCLAAEDAMEEGLRHRLSSSGQMVFDWVQWFLKMRAYDYMCMGFVLLTFSDTLRYWGSIYYCIHLLVLGLLLIGHTVAYAAPRSPVKAREQMATASNEKKLEE